MMRFLLSVFLILARSASILGASVCRPGEIAVGVQQTCTDPLENTPPTCHALPYLFSDQCVTIDTDPNGDTDMCEQDPNDWEQHSKISCDPNQREVVQSVTLANGRRYGSQPQSNDFACYKVSQFCARFANDFTAVSWCCPEVPPPPPPPPVPPKNKVIKIMVAGDSISHGMEGDWTWRYRLWAWCKWQDEFFPDPNYTWTSTT